VETPNFLDGLKLEKDIAVEWFKIHADQRLRLFNFFLFVAAFCVGGYFTALQAKSYLAASTVAALLFAICICFKLLDKRTSQLVWHGEAMIDDCISQLQVKMGTVMPNPVNLAANRGCVPSYRQTFNLIFILFGLVSIIGFLFPWLHVRFG
jgi:hypothetical protein